MFLWMGAKGVGMSEYHWPGKGYSPVLKSQAAKCDRCGNDARKISCENCVICGPEITRSRLFQVRLPLYTLELIKQEHGNVSAYLRRLIARDMGDDVFPPDFLKPKPAGNPDL